MPIRRNRRKETELYKVAASFFNKQSYASTSVRQICRAVQIRESSLYHYIKKKEDLLYDICERSMLTSLEVIEPIAQSSLRPDLKLQRIIETHIATIAQHSDGHSTMLKELRSLSVSRQRKIIKLRDRYETLLRGVVGECVQKGIFRNIDVKVTTLALLGMMNWLIHWYSPNGGMESEEIARIFSDLFIHGPYKPPYKEKGSAGNPAF